VRGVVPGLASPHPLGPTLPGLYQDDPLAQRLVGAFDEVAAPVFASLDGFDAWLDPLVAPEDVLDWLAGWVGVALDQTWPIERRRAFVASAVELFRLRGTATGLAAHVAIFTGGEVEVVESGAAGWSGAQPLTGNNVGQAPITTTTTYMLSCNGVGGSANSSKTVTVNAAPASGGGSGSFGLAELTVLGLIAIARRGARTHSSQRLC